MTKEVYQDAFNLMCGDLIGKGSSRTVYENRFDPTTVIKVEQNGGIARQNIFEYDAWVELSDEPAQKFLAPILFMSPRGRILVQKKTCTLPHKDYPDKIPRFFADTKYQNFGLLDGEFVCHDYAHNSIYEFSYKVVMVKAKWWSE